MVSKQMQTIAPARAVLLDGQAEDSSSASSVLETRYPWTTGRSAPFVRQDSKQMLTSSPAKLARQARVETGAKDVQIVLQAGCLHLTVQVVSRALPDSCLLQADRCAWPVS